MTLKVVKTRVSKQEKEQEANLILQHINLLQKQLVFYLIKCAEFLECGKCKKGFTSGAAFIQSQGKYFHKVSILIFILTLLRSAFVAKPAKLNCTMPSSKKKEIIIARFTT